jgi:flagellar hook-associated protein 1 FlgK
MGLSSALATAMSGLRANQAALAITSGNVANAQTPGYVAESANQTELATGTGGTTVQVQGVTRELDTFIQSQLRTETGGAGFAGQMSDILGQMQSLYGTPGGSGTLETAFNNFTGALQSLSTSSSGLSSQTTALGDAQALTQQLNVTSQGIQSLRTNVEQDIGTSVNQANNDLQTIAALNTRLQGLGPNDPSAATLEDQRDDAVNDLASLVDVKAITDGANQVSILTTTGVQLVSGTQASQFAFSSAGSLSPTSLYSSNPSQNGVGSLTVKLPNGANIDAIANNVISSGRIAADIQLRDTTLVQAQNQVDQLAASMASTLSNVTTQGTPVSQAVPPGTLSGFTLDLSNMQPGNTINLTYTNNAGQQQAVQIVDVTDPKALPLPSPAGANPQVIGINFSGSLGTSGISSIVSQLNAALGSAHLQFSNPNSPGNTLQIAANSADSTTVNSASTTTTATALMSGIPQLAVFTDAGSTYTGAITSSGSELTGLAGRIAVNPALLANPSALTVYNNNPTTPAGDNTRSNFLFSQLTTATSTYSPSSGLGSKTAPFTGTVGAYLQQFVSLQASTAAQATNLQQGQAVVLSTLQQKFNATSQVSIDSEMSNLIALQNSYAANAHVMSVVQSMMQTLMQAQV